MKPSTSIPRYNKNNIEKCQLKFKTNILENLNNVPLLKKNLISLSLNCNLQNELIRPISWKIFLKTLSCDENTTLRTWINETYEKREAFKMKVKKIKEENAEIDSTSKIKTNSYSNFDQYSSLIHLIKIDVERTYPDSKLFQNEYIRELEEVLLNIFAVENKPVTYKQGMNEILAMLILCFYPFYITSPIKIYTQEKFELWISNPTKYLNQIYSFFHDENEFICDLYYVFYNIMNIGLNKLYDDETLIKDPETNKSFTYLMKRCDDIEGKLSKYNYSLYEHFYEIGLNLEIILQRWLKCVFTREFMTDECVYIWDNVLGNEMNSPSNNLEYLDNFCIALFDYLTNTLLNKDQNDCLLTLFKFPPVPSMNVIIELSEKVKHSLSKSGLLAKINKKNISEGISNISTKMTTSISKLFDEGKNIVGKIKKNKDNNDNNESNKNEPKKKKFMSMFPDEDAETKIMSNSNFTIVDCKKDLKELKGIIDKYKNKFSSEDKMKIDTLIYSLDQKI